MRRRDLPMFSSSSRTRILRVAIRDGSRQQHSKRCAAEFSFYELQVSAREQGAALGDRQPKSHARLLEGDGRLKERLLHLRTEAGSGVVYLHADRAVFDERPAQDDASGASRVCRVIQQVRQDSLDQVGISMRRRWLRGQTGVEDDVGVCGPEQGETLFEQSIEIYIPGLYRRLSRELTECADAPFERADLVDNDLRRLLEEGLIAVGPAGHDLFDRQSNRRE